MDWWRCVSKHEWRAVYINKKTLKYDTNKKINIKLNENDEKLG